MNLSSLMLKEMPFPRTMTRTLAERWAAIPRFSENDPTKPEWRPTQTMVLDIGGPYGAVTIKDEGDLRSNPSGTHKSRLAWELSTEFRDYALRVLDLPDQEINKLLVPHISAISSGNFGSALAHEAEKNSLPPPKILVGKDVSSHALDHLRSLRVELYQTDLSVKPLTPEDIRMLTRNIAGIESTSDRILGLRTRAYDWLAHELFNLSPREIYVPYGSGLLLDNIISWQHLTAQNALAGTPDPRLRASANRVSSIDVYGAVPENPCSSADKLTAPFRPFSVLSSSDYRSAYSLRTTGERTGVYPVTESHIGVATDILKHHCLTSPSGAAGLALYMMRVDQGHKPHGEVVIVNTGGTGPVPVSSSSKAPLN